MMLLRLNRPSGFLLLLWPTLWATSCAHIALMSATWWWLVGGVAITRMAGCVANDLWDRDIDGHVARTQMRPLAKGDISVLAARCLCGLLLSGALLIALQLPHHVVWLCMPAAGLLLGYPYAKRVMKMPQLVLGFAFGCSVPITFATQARLLSDSVTVGLLFLITVCWALIYDTHYALADREDDRRLGLWSTTLFFEARLKTILGSLMGVMLILLGGLGWVQTLGIFYYAALLGVAALFGYQQVMLAPARSAALFQSHAVLGGVIYGGLLLG